MHTNPDPHIDHDPPLDLSQHVTVQKRLEIKLSTGSPSKSSSLAWQTSDRVRFQSFNSLATLHQKNIAIVIRIYTAVHVQSLSSVGPDLFEIFEVAERWVVADVWVRVSIQLCPRWFRCRDAVGRSFGVTHGTKSQWFIWIAVIMSKNT